MICVSLLFLLLLVELIFLFFALWQIRWFNNLFFTKVYPEAERESERNRKMLHEFNSCSRSCSCSWYYLIPYTHAHHHIYASHSFQLYTSIMVVLVAVAYFSLSIPYISLFKCLFGIRIEIYKVWISIYLYKQKSEKFAKKHKTTITKSMARHKMLKYFRGRWCCCFVKFLHEIAGPQFPFNAYCDSPFFHDFRCCFSVQSQQKQ